ncbi:unnamed protein product [Acanthosepion pharaonis]|uniref:G kinase-anchoring protein 1 n=1 Tax=Acanthosepion pharaonis TaxID=158019 RepID=A0A812C6V0_ACAPH|nr:unnamed protein product [Sepia pharaonis]
MAAPCIKVSQSRFAALRIDNDSDEEVKKPVKNNTHSTQQQPKKKVKKKKVVSNETAELKQLAFGKPTSKTKKSQNRNNQNLSPSVTDKQWEDWKRVDEEYTSDIYEKDLQQALLLSKLEFEQKSSNKEKSGNITASIPTPVTNNNSSGNTKSQAAENKKKRRKERNTPITLEEYKNRSRQNAKEKNEEETEETEPPPPIQTKISAADGDPNYFENVKDGVHRILKKEKMQEEYQKQYAVQSVLTAKHAEEMKQKDEELNRLREKVNSLEDELKKVKKRNRQLAIILSQAEIKEKSDILEQVDNLNSVKDELTDQVIKLTQDLEQEKSKVHNYKAELDKLKGSKHKGDSKHV